MYIGINISGRNLFTVAVIEEDGKISSINHFWKEGLYWFLEHSKVKVAVLNLNFRERGSDLKFRYLTDLMNVLLESFEFEQMEVKKVYENGRFVGVTDTDLFFEQAVSRDLLPVETREGVEQRIYTLSKAGIYVDENLFSTDMERLRSEVNAVVSSYTALSVEMGNYSFKEIEGIEVLVPEYRYVPKAERKYL
ncbi:MAG TPA: hypothetical protein DEP48_08165 [Persephonella sp.]|uniref:Uncharacterized protein n=1 Tax=Persephonella marina (strain DSM 14350 / EX-H1) TaxID=123214 RepID=C0QTQ2_PERMH|nr:MULTISPECIES: hypothetical protein [Persephonella]ACO04687.1 hypothetical protein PERMA_0272 [Persephonella marina EX-H1]HCB70317.1 hypothetical protein [Persephonella sp.]